MLNTFSSQYAIKFIQVASKPIIFVKKLFCFLLFLFLLFLFASTDAVALINSHFGATSGTWKVYLDEVQCTGSEANVTDCPRSSTISCYYSRSYAGVRCQGLEKLCNDVMFYFLFEKLILIFYSKCQWKLYLWGCSSGGRLQSIWG